MEKSPASRLRRRHVTTSVGTGALPLTEHEGVTVSGGGGGGEGALRSSSSSSSSSPSHAPASSTTSTPVGIPTTSLQKDRRGSAAGQGGIHHTKATTSTTTTTTTASAYSSAPSHHYSQAAAAGATRPLLGSERTSSGGGGGGHTNGVHNKESVSRKRWSRERLERARWALLMFLPMLALVEGRLLISLGIVAEDNVLAVALGLSTTTTTPSAASLANPSSLSALRGSGGEQTTTNSTTVTHSGGDIDMKGGSDVSSVAVAAGGSAPIIFGATMSLAIAVLIGNELVGTRRALAYVCVFTCACCWGSFIDSTEDLTAARLLCMLVFGVCAGQVRYLWCRREERRNHRRMLAEMRMAQVRERRRQQQQQHQQQHQQQQQMSGGAHGSGGTSSAGPCAPPLVPPQPLSSTLAPPLQYPLGAGAGASSDDGMGPASSNNDDPNDYSEKQRHLLFRRGPGGAGASGGSTSATIASPFTASASTGAGGPPPPTDLSLAMLRDVAVSFWDRVGLALLFTLGEVCGCLFCVPQAWVYIRASWFGYALLVALPILTYKISSWLSHLLTLVFGTRVNVSKASTLTLFYWVITTVLSLVIFALTLLFVVSSWVPYVWGLQKLVGPYALIIEYVAFASRRHQSSNPYQDIAEQYSQHIQDTIKNSRQFLL